MDTKQGTLFDLPTEPSIAFEPVLPPVTLDGFRQVSKDEFFRILEPLDAVVSAVPPFPYTSVFTLRNRELIGKVVSSYGFEYGKYVVKRYYISCNWQ